MSNMLKLAKRLNKLAADIEKGNDKGNDEEKVETLIREYRKKLRLLSGKEELGKLLVLLEKENYRKKPAMLVNIIDKAQGKAVDAEDFLKELRIILKRPAIASKLSIQFLKSILDYGVSEGKSKLLNVLKSKGRMRSEILGAAREA